VEREGDSLRFWVKDSGAGIDDNQLPKVFNRFWRAGRGCGAGLGLAVAKGIVETHGGQIGVTSQLGLGSTFFFTLPLDAATHAPAVRAAAAGAAVVPDTVATDTVIAGGACFAKERGPDCRVLLVDDDHDVVQSLVRLVRSFGYSVQVAFSGEEALQIAEHFRPQLVLMDVGMEGLNGYDTARRMRLREWAAGVNLVAVTGMTRDADRRRALEAGFDMHLTKPVSADVLERLLSARSR
jgi:CheY-like chemotaxis protein